MPNTIAIPDYTLHSQELLDGCLPLLKNRAPSRGRRLKLKLNQLGRTSLQVTEVCLGTLKFGNQVDEPTAFAILDTAYDIGVRFFDTADIYPAPGGAALYGRSEAILGRWLKMRRVRSSVVIATKVGKRAGATGVAADLSPTYIRNACEASLRRLQTDYIDLYQAHVVDSATPLTSTLEVLDDLVRAGSVHTVGCSNFGPQELVDALWTSHTTGFVHFASHQTEYSLLRRDAERSTLPLCRTYNLAFLGYSPLAGGLLTDAGARRAPSCDPLRDLHERVAQRGAALAQVALAWTLAQPGITSAIVGASTPEQLAHTLGVLEHPILDDDLRDACDAMTAARSES